MTKMAETILLLIIYNLGLEDFTIDNIQRTHHNFADIPACNQAIEYLQPT